MFVHDSHNQQIWIVGAKETLSNKFRVDIINTRNVDNLRIFIENHIEPPGTKIVTDGWPNYAFLDKILFMNTKFTIRVLDYLFLVYLAHHISKAFGPI